MSRQAACSPNLIPTISEFEHSPDRSETRPAYLRAYAAQLNVFPTVQS